MTITRTGPFEPRDGPPASDTATTAPDGPSAAPRPTPASWAPFGPARIGRYEILREIASGGMGRVYLGRAVGPLGFEKLVAIKTIHGELAKEQAFVDMFFDEARIASRIDHENVCRVFDFGEADGQYFLAMEYLVGVNLGRVLRALAKEHAKDDTVDAIAAHVIAEAAEALHAAHELADEHGRPLGVVHRDVSPQNIFVTFDGGVRVVDFGIASAEGRRHQTATGSLKGKFAYMAPEQLHREKADRRADVWALGVVLWELLTRERAFRAGTEIETVLAVLNDPVRHPREVRPTLDPNLDAIVMAALVKDRAERFENARALSRALRQWIVSKGQVVGSIEVAELLARLLPEERREAMALVDEARRTPARASSVPGASVRPAAPSVGAGTAAEMTRDLAAPPIVSHDGSAEQPRAPAETAEPARGVQPPWLLPAGVGAGQAAPVPDRRAQTLWRRRRPAGVFARVDRRRRA